MSVFSVYRLSDSHADRASYLGLAVVVASLCALRLGSLPAEAAESVVIHLPGTRADPEVVTVNEGDTVVFVWDDLSPGLTESYTGDWKSQILATGETFPYTFPRPGTYVYRAQSGASTNAFYYPGVIKVQAVTNGYPAVWIRRPLDNFTVPGYTDLEAATTNSAGSVKSVDFYADGQYLGSVTNPPYVFRAITNSGTYDFTARVVDAAGQTNVSAPVRISFANQQLFGLWRLREGQTVFFKSAAGGPYCVEWSHDLQAWYPRIGGQQWGNTVIVDETTTNANVIQRFYRIVDCL